MDSNPRKVNHDEIPAPKPPEGWTPPPDPTPEELRKEALARLAKIDQCRAIEALIRDGWDDERIAANQGIDDQDSAGCSSAHGVRGNELPGYS